MAWLMLCSSYSVVAQNNLKQNIKIVLDSLLLKDSVTIYPSSVRIFDGADRLPENEYRVSNENIWLQPKALEKYKGKALKITYRVFNINFKKQYSHLDSTQVSLADQNVYIGYDKPKPAPRVIDNNLNYNGSFSRGFSIGNAQSLVLNSNFNLQLSGDLGNGINVAAAISDDNIPIQPEGNTRLLQEFDQVFIKVSKGETSVLAGDYQLQRPKGYFTNYLKKLKGLTVKNSSTINGLEVKTDASIAASRGKFARQTINVSEGNQGPYKLNGNNGERFLIVLSGTEKVYLDGRLLQRGFDFDYVIDYNRAEVIFTPKTLIRRETRIIVEFEYTDQSYLRTLYTVNNYLKKGNWDMNINFYNEQDSKTATGDILLDSTDLNILSLAGDDISQSRRSGIFPLNDSSRVVGRVTYLPMANTNPQDSAEQILVYSDNFSLPLVTASFTEVGTGLGSYDIDTETAVNGRVYKYVGPGNGSYVPEIQIVPPEKKQMFSVGSSYKFSENTVLQSELSLSNNDINRLSAKDDLDNIGTAGVLKFSTLKSIGKKWQLGGDIHLENLQKNYKALNPYRAAEFNRDWNIPTLRSGAENYVAANLKVNKGDSLNVKYELQKFDITQAYEGIKHRLSGNWTTDIGLQSTAWASLLNSEGYGESTNFLRAYADVKQMVHSPSGHQVGFIYDGERNQRKEIDSPDELKQESTGYDILKMYFKNSDQSKLNYLISYSNRNDYFPSTDLLIKGIVTNEVSSRIGWNITPGHNLNLIMNYRIFDVVDDNLVTGQSDKNTLLGKVDHNINLWKGTVLANTTYTINSGQQPKVEFFYERVPVGQGDYIYVGNEDSTLVNINFRYAPDLGTGNYIRLSLINGEFISTNTQTLTHNLRLSPSKLWSLDEKSSSLKKVLSKLSTISTIRLNKSEEAENGVSYFNFGIDSTTIVQFTGLMVNTLFINKGQRPYDIQLSQRRSSSVFSQISGLETRIDNNYSSRARFALGTTSDFILELATGHRFYNSEQFDERDYNIDTKKLNPRLSLRPKDNIRLIFDYAFESRNETNKNIEALSHEFAGEVTYQSLSKMRVSGKFSFINVTYDGAPGSALEFDLLQGLKGGRNFLWNSNITRRLQNNIDLTLSYEGRKNGISPVVHIGRAQVKATF